MVKVSFKATFPVDTFYEPFWPKHKHMPEIAMWRSTVTFDCRKKTVSNGLSEWIDRDGNSYEDKSRDRIKERKGSFTWLAFEYLCERPQAKPKTAPTLK
jgi:hypothetical protein